MTLTDTVAALSRRVADARARRDQATAFAGRARGAADAARRGAVLLASAAEVVQSATHKRLAGCVAACLSAVFDDPYRFDLKFRRTKTGTVCNLMLMRDGHHVDPMTGSGGGVLDVASLALRVASLSMARPKKRHVLILDEPFKHLHGKENRRRAVRLLHDLSRDYDLQIIMVTGQEWLSGDDPTEV